MSDDKLAVFRVTPRDAVFVETPAQFFERRRVQRLKAIRRVLVFSYIALGFALAAVTVGIIGTAIDARPLWTNVYAIAAGVVFTVFNALRIRGLRREARRS